jgi:hypothetical protein
MKVKGSPTMKRKAITIIIVILIVIIIFPNSLVQAYSNYMSAVSYNKNGITTTAAIENGQILFYDLPSWDDYTYLHFWMEDNIGNRYCENKIAMRHGHSASFSIAPLEEGRYYVQLLTTKSESGQYIWLIWGLDLSVVVRGGTAWFNAPDNYKINSEVFSNYRTDAFALMYYMSGNSDYDQPPYYDFQSERAPELIALAESITFGISDDYEKTRAIYEWVVANIWYDCDMLLLAQTERQQSPVQVVQTRRATCTGYSMLTAALLRASGIPAKFVAGYAKVSDGESGFHAWNEAYANGRWIFIDTTWDSNNVYSGGVYSSVAGARRSPSHFDLTIEDLSATHLYRISSDASIPQISEWLESDVNNAAEHGLIPDVLMFYPPNSIKRNQLNTYTPYQGYINRAQFCALAVQFYETVTGIEISERRYFADTSDINIEKIGGLGVVTGVGNDRFDPNGIISREQAAVILTRLAERLGQPLAEYTNTFSDSRDISAWAAMQIGQVQGVGVMGGTGNNRFSPKQAVTIEESIAVIARLYDILTIAG